VLLDEKLVNIRPEIMKMLGEQGIGSSVYYPQPVPRMSFYKEKYGYEENRYRNATRISDGMLALPVGPHLNTQDMEIIGEELTQIMKAMK
jgi:dTDP-4-amino-4,6-dideoxygalactose transaminase